MRSLPDHPALRTLARRVVWFKSPGEAIAMPLHFVAHVLTYGTHDDVDVLRRFLSDDDLREALACAPPGVFDDRSWAYWNLKLGREPVPPLPVRRLDHDPRGGGRTT